MPGPVVDTWSKKHRVNVLTLYFSQEKDTKVDGDKAETERNSNSKQFLNL